MKIPRLPLTLIDNEHKEYTICYSRRSGGGAGKSRNKTSCVHVMYNHFIVKMVRFMVGDVNSKLLAIRKCMIYAVGPKRTDELLKQFGNVND